MRLRHTCPIESLHPLASIWGFALSATWVARNILDLVNLATIKQVFLYRKARLRLQSPQTRNEWIKVGCFKLKFGSGYMHAPYSQYCGVTLEANFCTQFEARI